MILQNRDDIQEVFQHDNLEKQKICFSLEYPVSDVKMFLDVLNQYELDKQINLLFIDFKSLTFEQKKELFKNILNMKNLSNSILILNIINFIKSYNTFAKEFFQHEKIIFNDITEFLDLKMSLKNELQIFYNDFAEWYFSLFRSVHKVDVNYLENIECLPDLYRIIIQELDYFSISGIIIKANFKDIVNEHLVKNAYDYISLLSLKNIQTNELLNNLSNEFKKNNSDNQNQ